MNRFTVTMRHDSLDFLLRSLHLDLRCALHCPEMTQDKDLKLPAL